MASVRAVAISGAGARSADCVAPDQDPRDSADNAIVGDAQASSAGSALLTEIVTLDVGARELENFKASIVRVAAILEVVINGMTEEPSRSRVRLGVSVTGNRAQIKAFRESFKPPKEGWFSLNDFGWLSS